MLNVAVSSALLSWAVTANPTNTLALIFTLVVSTSVQLEPLLEMATRDKEAGLNTPPPPRPGGDGRRQSTMPLIEIARAGSVEEAMAGLDRWKQRHPGVWPQLHAADVLVDSMRGRSSTWTRIRLNLQHVPEDQRPPQERLEVDYDPWQGLDPSQFAARPDREVRHDDEAE